MGYTPRLVTGVWVGNTDNSAMDRVAGPAARRRSGIASCWPRWTACLPSRSPSLRGARGGDVRRHRIATVGSLPRTHPVSFRRARPPRPPEQDLWQKVRIDKVTGKLATEFTPADLIEEKVFKVYPEPYRQWAEEHGIPQPPSEQSDVFTQEPNVRC
ncbi:MAG: hypothetical protein R2856_11720 [Caldilineaceae bacterium]